MKPFFLAVFYVIVIMASPAVAKDEVAVDVLPMEDWSEFTIMQYGSGPVRLHLRTGYQRPIIMPEPVSLTSRARIAGLDVEIDTEVVILSPGDHFKNTSLTFRGLQSGNDYHVEVRSSTMGSRKPVRLEY